jgi:hypothetical protein
MPLPAAYALRKLGRDIALARRRRDISTGDMAERPRFERMRAVNPMVPNLF